MANVLLTYILGIYILRSEGWFGLNRDLVTNGVVVRAEDSDKYTETRGRTSFTLTIHNTNITDQGEYRCRNGFDECLPVRLNIECKASSAVPSVTQGKKITITVDKLYPLSLTFSTSFKKENTDVTIPGSRSCTSSRQYPGYYRCVWSSSNSVADGSYMYSIVVTTITKANPLTGYLKIVSPLLPVIANVVKLNDSRTAVYGNEGLSFTLKCISSGGYPTPTVVWYKDSVSSSNQLSSRNIGTLQSDGTYTVTLQYTFTPTLTDDNRTLICRSYYPQADSSLTGSLSSTVKLHLILKPSDPTVIQVTDVTAGGTVEVRCTTTGSRPAANITWSYQGSTYTGTIISTFYKVTETYTVISVYRRQVTAADNGRNIKCVVTHPALISPSEKTASVNMNVQYPPDVLVFAKNTSVKAESVLLTCNASGVPNSQYKYSRWIQKWPGTDVIVKEYSGSPSLVLDSLTYEHSGVYSCFVSNGIKVFGTDKEYIEGSVQLLVQSFPVILNVNKKVFGRLTENVTIQIDYYSNVEQSDVKCYKTLNGSRQLGFVVADRYEYIKVNLTVFSHSIITDGTRAFVMVRISLKADFGFYDIVVTNNIDAIFRTIEIVPKVSPSEPYSVTLDNVRYESASLSWMRGSHGGAEQSFVVEVSTDQSKWREITTVSDGVSESEVPISAELTGLRESTLYFLRMYAFNEEGNSSYTAYVNFTTLRRAHASNESSSLIGGVAGGASAVVLIAVVVVIILRHRNMLSKRTILSTLRHLVGKNQKTDDSMHEMSPSDNARDIYEQLQQGTDRPERNVYDSLEVTSPRTLMKDMYEQLQQGTDRPERNVYDSLEVNSPRTLKDKTLYENFEQAVGESPLHSGLPAASPRNDTNITYGNLQLRAGQAI